MSFMEVISVGYDRTKYLNNRLVLKEDGDFPGRILTGKNQWGTVTEDSPRINSFSRLNGSGVQDDKCHFFCLALFHCILRTILLLQLKQSPSRILNQANLRKLLYSKKQKKVLPRIQKVLLLLLWRYDRRTHEIGSQSTKKPYTKHYH